MKESIQQEYQFRIPAQTQTKVFSVKYCMNESCFIFWTTAKVSLVASVSRVILFEVIKSKHTGTQRHTTYTKENRKSYALLVLFYFIIFLDVSLFDACLCFIHTIFPHFTLYYYVNGAQLRCIAFPFSRNLVPSCLTGMH